jgi:hypothetical protein
MCSRFLFSILNKFKIYSKFLHHYNNKIFIADSVIIITGASSGIGREIALNYS